MNTIPENNTQSLLMPELNTSDSIDNNITPSIISNDTLLKPKVEWWECLSDIEGFDDPLTR